MTIQGIRSTCAEGAVSWHWHVPDLSKDMDSEIKLQRCHIRGRDEGNKAEIVGKMEKINIISENIF